MTVMPVPGSRLVDVSYIDPSPARAQQIANGYADAYIASNLDKRFEANSYAKTFLEDQVKQLKIRLEESEKALLDFAEQEKMVEVTDKASIAENNLAAANAAVGQLISERMKNEQLWRQVENPRRQSICRSFWPMASSRRSAASARRSKPNIRKSLRTSSQAIQPWFRSQTK